MKKFIKGFLFRGLLACGGGPLILAIIYAVLDSRGVMTSISPAEAAKAILTIMELAFVAGGITVIYQVEKLPLFSALLIHGGVLYLDYLSVYLINGWLASGAIPVIIFTACFVLGYALIWTGIYFISVRKVKRLNEALKK